MADKIHYEQQENLAVLTMDDGKANAIDFAWIDEMDAALDRALAERIDGVLIRGRANIFCAGLDLKKLPTYPAAELRRFVARYQEIKTRLFTLPLPVTADVEGHALAGGAVLLLCCDRAVTDATPKQIGLNETQVGIVLPHFVIAMGKARLNPAAWTEAMVAGAIYDPTDALAAGYISQVTPVPEERTAAAWAAAKGVAALPAEPYRRVKAALREGAMADVPDTVDPAIGEFFGAEQ